MPDDYKIKSNKHSNVQPAHTDAVSIFGMGGFPGVMHLLRKITGYQSPPEEKEHVLTELPGPDFDIEPKDRP